MAEDRPRKLAPWKRLLGIVLLTSITLASALGGYLLVQGGSPVVETPEPEGFALLMSSLFEIVLGVLFFGAGIFAYVVVLVTHAFTFDFNRPYWGSLKIKLWVFNIAVLVLAAIGLGFVGQAVLGPILAGFSLPASLTHIVPMIGALLLVQVVLVAVNIWASLETSCIRRRLGSYGVTQRELEGGWPVGISDPAKSSLKKMTFIEEDLGMLWFHGDQLIYRGDSQSFEVPRDEFLEVERSADSGNVQALGGAVHVILRFRTEGGAEGRVRLHAMGCWHMGAVKKELEKLAARLSSWRQPLPAAAPSVDT